MLKHPQIVVAVAQLLSAPFTIPAAAALVAPQQGGVQAGVCEAEWAGEVHCR